MKLYDNVILKVQELVRQVPGQTFLSEDTAWGDVTDKSMILRSDMAYELGGEALPAIGCTLITSESSLVRDSHVHVIGKDLQELTQDTPFARISMVRVKEGTLGEGEALYKVIRNLEYTRYHFYPEGFMLRVSDSKHKECVRVGKEAIKKGLNFSVTGNKMAAAFKRNPIVEEVQTVYITDPAFPFDELKKLSRQAEDITKTIDHILKDSLMDCHTCHLQEVCNEVEGLKELHFKK